MMNADERTQILTAAVAAPSGDNSQPWRLRWCDERLELWIDESRSGRYSDAAYLLSDLALGACLENVCVQGAALGYTAEVALLPEPESAPRWVASITWSEAAGPQAGLAPAIAERHTDRSFPWRGVADEARDRLQEAVAGDGARLLDVSAGESRKQASRALVQAESLRFSSRILHEELFRAARFDVGWHQTACEGLPPGALAIEPPFRPVFKALKSWPLMHAFNRLGAAPMLGLRAAYLPVATSPLLFLLVAQSPQRQHIVAAGRLLERFWLTATAAGLAVQPYAAVGAVAHGAAALEPRWLPRRDALRARLDELCGDGQGLLFLRVGVSRAKPTAMRSGRRAPADFILPPSVSC
jgi:hypothetical protein